MAGPDEYNDQKMDMTMGAVLRTGVILCCAIMAAGAILYLLRHGGEHSAYTHFRGEPAPFESVAGVFREAAAGSARGIIQLGALFMIATPVVRVIFAAIGFARLKDWKFVGVSLAVLGLLIFGLNK